ncbi:MAG: hypothetical protein PVI90_05890 [Desulfobacteraceae bacterium]|jgi:hypothetical protein
MKKDILRLSLKGAVIGLIFVMINIYAYATSPYFKKQRNYHSQIESYFDKNAKVLIIGDSHPGVLKNNMLNKVTYNVASGGDGLKESYLKLKYILERSQTIEVVFLTSDAQMFSTRRVQSSNAAFLHKYSLLLNEMNVYKNSYLSVIVQMVPFFNDSYIEYINKDLQNIISDNKKQVTLNQTLRDDEFLWSTDFTPLQRVKRAVETGKKDHTGVMENEILLKYYNKIITLCKKKNIRVIGVRFPAMKEYFEQLSPQKNHQLEAFLKGLPFEKILDYRNFTQNPELYNNEDHLNRDGALQLLRKMEKDTGIKLKI